MKVSPIRGLAQSMTLRAICGFPKALRVLDSDKSRAGCGGPPPLFFRRATPPQVTRNTANALLIQRENRSQFPAATKLEVPNWYFKLSGLAVANCDCIMQT
jgi:hypothetical protein